MLALHSALLCLLCALRLPRAKTHGSTLPLSSLSWQPFQLRAKSLLHTSRLFHVTLTHVSISTWLRLPLATALATPCFACLTGPQACVSSLLCLLHLLRQLRLLLFLPLLPLLP